MRLIHALVGIAFIIGCDASQSGPDPAPEQPDAGLADPGGQPPPDERELYGCGLTWTCRLADGEEMAGIPAHICASASELTALEAIPNPCDDFVPDDCLELLECNASCERMDDTPTCSCPFGGPCLGNGTPLDF